MKAICICKLENFNSPRQRDRES